VRFEGLKAASMKMDVFWDVASCSLVEVYRRFRSTCCLHHQGESP
jgi:glycogen synthase